jgi:hypothetical protein
MDSFIDKLIKNFWLVLTVAVLCWYAIVTVYVAIKGISDIKQMLANLEDESKK